MTYTSALTHYDQRRDPVDHVIEKVLPEDIGQVHAVRLTRFDRRGGNGPHFLSARWYERAMCGAVVKVLMPQEFDPGEDDACPRCVGPVLRGERAPAPPWMDDEPPLPPEDEEQPVS
ncbi:hypothetical protein [Modestobacter sp. KNN46-3]|uniref:hypothetical protein n=1 Tax=Modestobacter sp. KNN46-3 TaxID=2711218 RepID=UPI0013E05769|nr:hypothetical protein [Modestobacter sp. KNN46-3]